MSSVLNSKQVLQIVLCIQCCVFQPLYLQVTAQTYLLILIGSQQCPLLTANHKVRKLLSEVWSYRENLSRSFVVYP